MDGLIIAFLVPTLIFVVLVVPFWILMYYRSKQRSRHELSAEESRMLAQLLSQAEAMQARIQALEAILDRETPDWRRANGESQP